MQPAWLSVSREKNSSVHFCHRIYIYNSDVFRYLGSFTRPEFYAFLNLHKCTEVSLFLSGTHTRRLLCIESWETHGTIVDPPGLYRPGLIHRIYSSEVYTQISKIKLEKYLISGGTGKKVPPPISCFSKRKVKFKTLERASAFEICNLHTQIQTLVPHA